MRLRVPLLAVLVVACGGALADAHVPGLSGALAGTQLPGAVASRASTPSCFGAAARDPEHPCTNSALASSVTPKPFDAPLEPSQPCSLQAGSNPEVCSFGVPAGHARRTFALIGDSHAVHWRAALARIAAQRRWHGVSVTRSNCPFTLAHTPGKGACKGWPTHVVAWLRKHPEVRTVVTSANSGSVVRATRGRSMPETKIAGFQGVWRALPKSVKTIYVIHDVPHARFSTASCVSDAVAAGHNPGVRCARARYTALRPDMGAIAASSTSSKRVKLIDLTDFMCDRQQCFPVVGGALVIKDIGHMTRTFSWSLGPYLLRAMDAASAPAHSAPGATTPPATTPPPE